MKRIPTRMLKVIASVCVTLSGLLFLVVGVIVGYGEYKEHIMYQAAEVLMERGEKAEAVILLTTYRKEFPGSMRRLAHLEHPIIPLTLAVWASEDPEKLGVARQFLKEAEITCVQRRLIFVECDPLIVEIISRSGDLLVSDKLLKGRGKLALIRYEEALSISRSYRTDDIAELAGIKRAYEWLLRIQSSSRDEGSEQQQERSPMFGAPLFDPPSGVTPPNQGQGTTQQKRRGI